MTTEKRHKARVQPESKIPLGISACLLGESVRYDGGNKLDHYLRDTLGRFVEWVPVCPEVECGLPVPREAMRLVGDRDSPRLVTVESGRDHTDLLRRWVEEKLVRLEDEGVCGFVFKARSPSCGIRDAEIVSASGEAGSGPGLFAAAVMLCFPELPAEDEGRLQDPAIREAFLARAAAYRTL